MSVSSEHSVQWIGVGMKPLQIMRNIEEYTVMGLTGIEELARQELITVKLYRLLKTKILPYPRRW